MPHGPARPGALVAASSISFASADGESSSTPLRLLSPQKPLRWVFAGAPFPPGQAARGGGTAEAYGCRRPQAVGGSCATASQERRKERDTVQLSGGIPKGALPLGRTFGDFSCVRKVTPAARPGGLGAEPPTQRACRHPRQKGRGNRGLRPLNSHLSIFRPVWYTGKNAARRVIAWNWVKRR